MQHSANTHAINTMQNAGLQWMWRQNVHFVYYSMYAYVQELLIQTQRVVARARTQTHTQIYTNMHAQCSMHLLSSILIHRPDRCTLAGLIPSLTVSKAIGINYNTSYSFSSTVSCHLRINCNEAQCIRLCTENVEEFNRYTTRYHQANEWVEEKRRACSWKDHSVQRFHGSNANF